MMAKKKTANTPNGKNDGDRFLGEPTILSRGKYLQLVTRLRFTDDAIIRSNEPEEVLTFRYKSLDHKDHFVIPWRKIKGKLRRLVLEQQRSFEIHPECHLKDSLCMKCPSCFLFGGTGETSQASVSYNILSRVLGESFISLSPREGVTPYTANAVDEVTLSTTRGETGALFTINKVPAETEFIGVITLRDPTREMAGIILDNLARLTRLGARSVEWGKVVASVEGWKLTDREDMSALQLVKQKGEHGLESPPSDWPSGSDAFSKLDGQVTTLLSNEGLSS